MTFDQTMTLIGIVLSVLVAVVSCVWVVSKNTASNDALLEAVRELSATVAKLDDKLDDHADRIARLETHSGLSRERRHTGTH